jgi:hypothetical protein
LKKALPGQDLSAQVNAATQRRASRKACLSSW